MKKLNTNEDVNSTIRYLQTALIFTLLIVILLLGFTCIMTITYSNRMEVYREKLDDAKDESINAKLGMYKAYSELASLENSIDDIEEYNKKVVDENKKLVEENYDLQKKIKKYKKIELEKRKVASYKTLFTGYFPDDSEIEGGFFDISGHLLDANELTCAAPPEIPIGTQILISRTGTSKDGKIYTVTDRGGAIKVMGNGDYHIDLLFSTNEECEAWGKRYGVLTILKPSDENDD